MSIGPESLGSTEFRKDYGLRYAYLAGAMYKGIASRQLVVAMGNSGLMGFFGTGGCNFAAIEDALHAIKAELHGRPYGMNLLCDLEQPAAEERIVELFLREGVPCVEAAAFMRMTPALVRWRLSGIRRGPDGRVMRQRRTLAKVSRPEVASAFMQPAPESIVKDLLAAGKITGAEAELSHALPMADDICVEADSAGHTDQGVAMVLLPTIMRLRDDILARHRYDKNIRVGLAGGIGAPEAAVAAFAMGADFILTGSINQCTVEAGTSDSVKDLLQELEVQDTDYAPAGDMFEIGARVQVAKRGLLFPARANKLYELYQRHNSLEEIDARTRQQIQEKYFRCSFDEAWEETCAYYQRTHPTKIAAIEKSPKLKMAAIFKWYFVQTTRLAMRGIEDRKVDYQIHCGPALGAFNQWVKGTEIENWRLRRVADIAHRLMTATAAVLDQRYRSLTREPAAAISSGATPAAVNESA